MYISTNINKSRKLSSDFSTIPLKVFEECAQVLSWSP